MTNESKFTEQVLDYISDYVALTKMSKHDMSTSKCLQYVAEKLQCPLLELDEAFGDIVDTEIKRVSTATAIDESTETFSKAMLLEDDTSDAQAKVDAAEKTQKNNASDETALNAQAAKDKQANDGNAVRKYFAFVNFVKGQMYICSELENATNFANKQLMKLGNFLATCVKPTFTRGILVAPISFEDAKQYLAANRGKIKYLDVTPNATPEQQQEQKPTEQTKQQDQQQNQQQNQQQQEQKPAEQATEKTEEKQQ